MQDFAASASDPKKLTLVKGSKYALGCRILLPLPRTRRNLLWSKAANMPWDAGFCCLRQGPEELNLVKGSKSASGSRILLPPPRTHLNPFWSKAAKVPQEAGFCCFCLGPEETHFGQRQQTCLGKQDFAASASDPMKRVRTRGIKHLLGSSILLLLLLVSSL